MSTRDPASPEAVAIRKAQLVTAGEARFDRLPKWAQNKINKLQADHEEAARLRDKLLGILRFENTDGERIIVDPSGETPWSLPVGAVIRFHLDQTGERYLDVSMVDSIESHPGALHVIGSGTGLAISPVSGNYVAITASKR